MEVLNKFNRYIDQNGKLLIIKSYKNPFSVLDTLEAKDEASAMNVFLDELRIYNERNSKWNYCNRRGNFFFNNTLKVKGLINGSCEISPGNTEFCTYVVFNNSEDGLDSYVQALEIIIETCEWVLDKEYPENYILHWCS